MQPFDGGAFDKRFDGVLVPAIKSAGLEPYRVDRDPMATIPIDQIGAGIQASAVCLAEITLDNPNVWFELGYAIACEKPVVLICSTERKTKFPFDVQHRSIITYSSEAPSDFEALQLKIQARIEAELIKERRIERLATSPVVETSGLESHEIAALVTIMQSGLETDSPPSGYSLKGDMERAGYTPFAAVIAVKKLMRVGFVEPVAAETYNAEQYTGYIVTDAGEMWLLQNQDRLALRISEKKSYDFDEDDLPF